MVRIASLAVVVCLGGFVAPAGAAEFLHVVRGDLLLGNLEGERIAFQVSGVWVPSPPGLREQPEYRGAEARQFVAEILASQPVFLYALRPPEPGKVVRVRVLVGEEAGQDLAVLLAAAGLAMGDPLSAADREQAAAIRSAEREARRKYLGIHDGGFQTFERSRSQRVDLGVTVLYKSMLGRRLGASHPAHGVAAVGGKSWWLEPSTADFSRTPVQAIRDWGASLGLPRDDSALGR